MPLSICFILGELGPSGGANAVALHASGLARDHGHDVAIALRRPPAPGQEPPPGVRFVAVEERPARPYDVAIATWWRTAYDLFSVPARRRAYYVQQFDERVYRPGDVERIGAVATHDLPVAFLTEARWIADQLGELRPEASCFHVPNGIDKERFAPAGEAPAGGPLRVLVEGSAGLWFKGVDDAAAALELAREPIASTLVAPEPVAPPLRDRFDAVVGPLDHAAMADAYRAADVVLKLSRVEGVFTPPLEAFHCGVPCVVWPVTGHDEYVAHAVNGAVADFDDLPGTAAWIDLLARDRELLARLGRGALETAARWPSWERSTTDFAAAVDAIASGPDPAPGAGVEQLLADLDAAMETQRVALDRERRATQAVSERLLVAEGELAAARRAIAELEQSASWRYTAWMRRLKDRIRARGR